MYIYGDMPLTDLEEKIKGLPLPGPSFPGLEEQEETKGLPLLGPLTSWEE